MAVAKTCPHWKCAIYICLWRKSGFHQVENRRVVIQVPHFLCGSGFVGVVGSLCLARTPYGKRASFRVILVHGTCIDFSSSRRRGPVTCCAKLVGWARKKSPWVLHFNSGACNGCDIEVVALLTPRYDVERFGILLEPSPRHADVLMVTGVVTRQCADRLKLIHEQMPSPKSVVAIGACACSGGVFEGNYNVLGGADKVIPVDVYIPGCPPKPEAMIDGIAKLLSQRGKGRSDDEC